MKKLLLAITIAVSSTFSYGETLRIDHECIESKDVDYYLRITKETPVLIAYSHRTTKKTKEEVKNKLIITINDSTGDYSIFEVIDGDYACVLAIGTNIMPVDDLIKNKEDSKSYY